MPRQDHLCRAAATTGTETPNECFGSMRRLTVFVITTVAASAISMAGFQLLSVSGARAAKPDASEELSQGVAQLPATAPHQAWASPPRRSGADKVATQPTKLVTAPLASAKTPAPVHPAFTAVPHSIVVSEALDLPRTSQDTTVRKPDRRIVFQRPRYSSLPTLARRAASGSPAGYVRRRAIYREPVEFSIASR